MSRPRPQDSLLLKQRDCRPAAGCAVQLFLTIVPRARWHRAIPQRDLPMPSTPLAWPYDGASPIHSHPSPARTIPSDSGHDASLHVFGDPDLVLPRSLAPVGHLALDPAAVGIALLAAHGHDQIGQFLHERLRFGRLRGRPQHQAAAKPPLLPILHPIVSEVGVTRDEFEVVRAGVATLVL